ncbi:hypothetical protein D9V86_09590 [Bacteroidetes/Chlorobi group bacterium ChocPot_Mid]|nr:MAG: hypothetical protein D9V86_09590 [Bacteroidetes/Chlorobi group bacterium ChocPot_Mid]
MKNIFATLCGTNSNNTEYLKIYSELLDLAYKKGFFESKENQRIFSDQTSLENWSLWLKGSSHENCKFMLAVTAPKVPTIAPIPITLSINVPLFAVLVFDDFYGIMNNRNYNETKDSIAINSMFENFIESLI